MMALPSQLFLETIADAKRQPAALRLHPTVKDAESLTALLGSAAFSGLAAKIPCVLVGSDADGLPAPLLEALRNAGGQLIDAAAIAHRDAPSDAALDATYLAGDWYLQPPAKPVSSLAASRALALKLLQLVAADADNRELEAIFRHDPAMSYQLLRLVNSLGMGNRKITSFAQAILILGRSQLRRWINLMLFTPRKEDPRLPMLMARVSVRARTMELLARATGLDKAAQESAFMAGMFSLLGALFGMPLAEVLRPLNVGEELNAAVLRDEGVLGQLLATVAAAEKRDDAALTTRLAALNTPALDFDPIQIDAHAWMLELLGETAGGAHG